MEDPTENNNNRCEEATTAGGGGGDVESPELSLSPPPSPQQQQLQQNSLRSSSFSSSGIGGGGGGGGSGGGSSQQQQQYPTEFYCPITKLLMKDPVVLADGLSYERSSAESEAEATTTEAAASSITTTTNNNNNSNNESSPTTTTTAGGTVDTTTTTNTTAMIMYSNRSLKLIIEESTRTALQKFQHSAKQFLVGGNIKSVTGGTSAIGGGGGGGDYYSSGSSSSTAPLSNGFYCPITLGLMYEPVIDPQGYTYERVAIENWIAVNGDSPVTREPLTTSALVENKAISNLLQREANRKDTENIHPAILKWMNESPPVISLELTTTRNNNNDNDTLTDVATDHDTTNLTPAAAATLATTTTPFPVTRQEFELQQQISVRNQRIRMLTRLALVVFALCVIVAGFFVPIIAAIALVVVVLGIILVTKDAAN